MLSMGTRELRVAGTGGLKVWGCGLLALHSMRGRAFEGRRAIFQSPATSSRLRRFGKLE